MLTHPAPGEVYHVTLTASAKKDLAALDTTTRRRVTQKLVTLATMPRSPDTLKLTNENRYRTRIGNYRILYTIDDTTRTVTVTNIKHRREAYR